MTTYLKTAFDVALAIIGVKVCRGLESPIEAGDVALLLVVVALLRTNARKTGQ